MQKANSDRGRAAAARIPFARPIRVGGLSRRSPVPFELTPEPEEKAAIARFLGLAELRALTFSGVLSPAPDEGWRIEGRLGARVVQACVATLEPVESAVDEPVARDYVPAEAYTAPTELDLDPEAEDDPDPFEDTIDPGALALESLALALDPYPRAPGAPFVGVETSPPGVPPIGDAETKPFAKLAELKEKLDAKKR